MSFLPTSVVSSALTWRGRVLDVITMTAPNGDEFEAYWTGNTRAMHKKVGVFRYPKVRGAKAQDLDIEEIKYPLTFHFEGPTHDLDAELFWTALKQTGPWTAIHPVKGKLTLQLMTITEEIHPVESGNITKMVSEWIEVGVDLPLVPAAALSADILDQTLVVKEAAATDFNNKLQVSKPGLLARLTAAVQKFTTMMQGYQSQIAGVSAMIAAQIALVTGLITAVTSSIMSVIATGVSAFVGLAGMVQNLIDLPGLIIEDAEARFSYYEDIIEASLGLSPSTPSVASLNDAALYEMIQATCVAGMARAALDATPTTRGEALGLMARLQTNFASVTAALDSIQDLYGATTIDRQYFSQTSTYVELSLLVNQASQLLLQRSFDLAVSKTITLRTSRAPIEIALTEGVDFDVLVDSNKLKGDDILLLPAGRQVVVYL